MGWVQCIGQNGGGGGGNYTDSRFDGTLKANTYIDAGGVEVSYNGWSSTDFIDVSDLEEIYLNGSQLSEAYNAWYDSGKNFISMFGMSYKLTIPANAKYMRLSQSTDIMQTIKVFTEV